MSKQNIDINKIINLYSKLKSVHKVAEKIGISFATVWKKLKHMGLINKYTCNDNFFTQDTPESFYWAGFIVADGCVSKKTNKNGKCLTITLSKTDSDHLDKFKGIIDYTGHIHFYKNNSSGISTITIRSSKMVDELERFGVVPRKTFIIKFPKWIENHRLVNHFIRGYCDGDGSIGLYKEGKSERFMFSALGTKNFLETMQNILIKHCNVNKTKISKIKNTYCFAYRGNYQCPRIFNFLYNGSYKNIRLDRKYEISALKPKMIKIGVSANRINVNSGFIKTYDTIASVEKDGFNKYSVWACCRGKRLTHKGYRWEYAKEKSKKA